MTILKCPLPCLLLLCLCAVRAQGQNAVGRTALDVRDSVAKMAAADARKFRLNRADLRKFRKDRRNSGSDYFKPSAAYARDSTLLRDSAYVSAFRQAAYQKTRKRRTAQHYAWVSVAVMDAIYVVLLAAVIVTGHGANLR